MRRRLHDFPYRLSNGKRVRVLVEELGPEEWTAEAFVMATGYEATVSEADKKEIDKLAQQAIESAKQRENDRIFDEWKDSQVN